VDLVLNQFDPGEPLAAEMAELAGSAFTGVYTIPGDPRVAACESAGNSLLSLSAASGAVAAMAGWCL
jgi:hypothetical protein